MTKLQQIIEHAAQRRLRGGGAISVELSNELRSYRRQQFWIFFAAEVFLVLGISFCAYFLARNPRASEIVKALAGLIGIGAGGGIEVMRRTWKEWSQTDLLLALISQASEAQVNSIIDKLIGKL
jgi:hypothetical protein